MQLSGFIFSGSYLFTNIYTFSIMVHFTYQSFALSLPYQDEGKQKTFGVFRSKEASKIKKSDLILMDNLA
jgi:hypothetical protein